MAKTAIRQLEDEVIRLEQAQRDDKWIVSCGLLANTIKLILKAIKEETGKVPDVSELGKAGPRLLRN